MLEKSCEIKPTTDLNISATDLFFNNLKLSEASNNKKKVCHVAIAPKITKQIIERIKIEKSFDCVITALKNGKEEGKNFFFF